MTLNAVIADILRFFNIIQYEPLAFKNAAKYPNAETNFLCWKLEMIALCSYQV